MLLNSTSAEPAIAAERMLNLCQRLRFHQWQEKQEELTINKVAPMASPWRNCSLMNRQTSHLEIADADGPPA